jgi:hypothetical protein
MLIENPRPFKTGLPTGCADLIGFTPTKIKPEHVGRTLAVFTAIEVKSDNGKTTAAQNNFLSVVKHNGGISGVARSPEDAVKIIRDGL